MKLTKHYANKGWFKQLLILISLMLFTPAVAVNAQRVFDIENPAGTYIITDYLNNKITLKLRAATLLAKYMAAAQPLSMAAH